MELFSWPFSQAKTCDGVGLHILPFRFNTEGVWDFCHKAILL